MLFVVGPGNGQQTSPCFFKCRKRLCFFNLFLAKVCSPAGPVRRVAHLRPVLHVYLAKVELSIRLSSLAIGRETRPRRSGKVAPKLERASVESVVLSAFFLRANRGPLVVKLSSERAHHREEGLLTSSPL